jgi:hypothetical protein
MPQPSTAASAPTGNWGDTKAGSAPAGPAFKPSAAGQAPAYAEASTVSIIRDVTAGESAEELASRIAAAPRNAGRRVATMRELDETEGRGALHAAASRTSGVELGLLTSALTPPDALYEADEVWEFDRLLGEAAQEIDAGGAGKAPATAPAPVAASGGAPSPPGPVGRGPAPVAGRRA